MLPNAEELKPLADALKSGSLEARDELIVRHLGLIGYVSKRAIVRYGVPQSFFEEFYSAATLKALKRLESIRCGKSKLVDSNITAIVYAASKHAVFECFEKSRMVSPTWKTVKKLGYVHLDRQPFEDFAIESSSDFDIKDLIQSVLLSDFERDVIKLRSERRTLMEVSSLLQVSISKVQKTLDSVSERLIGIL